MFLFRFCTKSEDLDKQSPVASTAECPRDANESRVILRCSLRFARGFLMFDPSRGDIIHKKGLFFLLTKSFFWMNGELRR